MPNGEEIFDEGMAQELLEKEKGQSRLERMREMAKEKAKEAIKKAAKKAVKKLAMAIGKAILAGLKALAVALAPALPYILIIGGIILAVFFIVSVLLSGDPAICEELSGEELSAVKSMQKEAGVTQCKGGEGGVDVLPLGKEHGIIYLPGSVPPTIIGTY